MVYRAMTIFFSRSCIIAKSVQLTVYKQRALGPKSGRIPRIINMSTK
jgi:hypothetical protein